MKKSILMCTGSVVLTAMSLLAGQGSQAANESLWEASRAGDTARITDALSQGADVNAKARYDVTPLIFAAGNGRLDAVKLLLTRGADVNAQDTFYRAREPTWRSPMATWTWRSFWCRTALTGTVHWRRVSR